MSARARFILAVIVLFFAFTSIVAKLGLLKVGKQRYKDHLSPSGRSTRNSYTVLPPFDAGSIDAAAATSAPNRRARSQ